MIALIDFKKFTIESKPEHESPNNMGLELGLALKK